MRAEYDNIASVNFLSQKGMYFHKNAPHIKQHIYSCVAGKKKKCRHIIEMARTFLIDADILETY